MSCVLGHVATLSRATFRKIRWFGFLDPTGDKILLGCYNRPANLSFEVSSTMGPKITHFGQEFDSVSTKFDDEASYAHMDNAITVISDQLPVKINWLATNLNWV
ncbi:unnamed protein product [Prunus armeniaca]|uniref:Uncharacterized protein n=1 Tax=Prunus armeniaca TaxID=36596 RepID=A0A6J5VKZ0_PRUAR|nr:unnamed protein product [Prunus armeniaca]